jgi:transposase
VSLQPQQPIPPVPEDTARIARAAFRRGNPYLLLRERLGAVFDDAAFADLYPKLGQPAYAPWRLALITLLQFREGLSDRQAADAVRGRIDWKYLLALELADAGFDFSVLCEFRGRLIEHKAGERLLERLLDAAREGGLLKVRGRQRTDSTHVLAAIRTLNRLELLGETMRAALNGVAAVAAEWLRTVAPADWHERYDCRVENARLPEAQAKREAHAVQIGADGFLLLDALGRPGAPERAVALPAVAVLRRVWARHFERPVASADGAGGDGPAAVRLLPLRARGDDSQPTDRIESPYDTEARFRIRAGREWVGYIAHFTETCDDHAPRLIVHADTTDASGHEATRIGPIHDALASKGLPPSEHLVDTAYIAAGQLVAARAQHGIDLIGPQHRDVRWQAADSDAFDISDFAVDWDREVVHCPEGKQSAAWATYANRKRPHRPVVVQVRFHPADCRACPSRARCTRAAPTRGRYLMLSPRPEHEALVAARARERTDEFRRLYAMRQGIESTISQGVRAFGLRRARYRGLAKVGLQHLATAAAINLDRLAAWFAGRPLAPTRVSRFAALTA